MVKAQIIKYPTKTIFSDPLRAFEEGIVPPSVSLNAPLSKCALVKFREGQDKPYKWSIQRHSASSKNNPWKFFEVILDDPQSLSDPLYNTKYLKCALIRRTVQRLQHKPKNPARKEDHSYSFKDEGLVIRPSRSFPGKFRRVAYFSEAGSWEKSKTEALAGRMRKDNLSFREIECSSYRMFPAGTAEGVIELI